MYLHNDYVLTACVYSPCTHLTSIIRTQAQTHTHTHTHTVQPQQYPKGSGGVNIWYGLSSSQSSQGYTHDQFIGE